MVDHVLDNAGDGRLHPSDGLLRGMGAPDTLHGQPHQRRTGRAVMACDLVLLADGRQPPPDRDTLQCGARNVR